MNLSRRTALLGLATSVGIGRTTLALASAATEKRLVVVILRGALDGMAAVVPYGDPGLAGLRGEIVPPAPGQPDGLLDLGGFFGLHPALAGVHEMYMANEALVVHAVAGSYRVRSHFEAQDYLESGADHRMTSGWLNRAVAALPPATAQRPEGEALAVGVSVPLLLRGPAPVANWAPHGFSATCAGPVCDDRGAESERPGHRAGDRRGSARPRFQRLGDGGGGGRRRTRTRFRRWLAPRGRCCARRMVRASRRWRSADGTRTRRRLNRLSRALKQLDAGLVALKNALGPAWAQTAVLVMTEFGRTARVNGTKGTDHGTGTVAFVVGGAVAGGRVEGDLAGAGGGPVVREPRPGADNRSAGGGQGHAGRASGTGCRRAGTGLPRQRRRRPDAGLIRV